MLPLQLVLIWLIGRTLYQICHKQSLGESEAILYTICQIISRRNGTVCNNAKINNSIVIYWASGPIYQIICIHDVKPQFRLHSKEMYKLQNVLRLRFGWARHKLS